MSWNIVEVKDTLALYLVLFALAVIILGYLSNHVFLTLVWEVFLSAKCYKNVTICATILN